MGNSQLRYVDPSKVSVDKVIAKGGAKFVDISQALLHMDTSFESIYLVIGTNEVLNKRVTRNTIINQTERMLTTARKYSSEVTVASIPYTNSNTHNKSVEEINGILWDFCLETNCTYVDINKDFDTKKMLHRDGIHLNQAGTRHLLQTLDITDHEDPTVQSPYEKVPNTMPQKGKKTTYADITKEKPVYFRGPSHPLSNLYNCNIWVDGFNFHSTEAAYQFSKLMTMAEHTTSKRRKYHLQHTAKKIQQTSNPWKAMELGDISTNDNWKEIKIDVMQGILIEKYAQCRDYRTYLSQTGKRPIIENTHNFFWGHGKHGDGLNILGRIHEWIRDTPTVHKQQPYKQQLPGNPHSYWALKGRTTSKRK